ncbi:hypothetical protein DMH04_34540 [Kibdelosporangium aridum]|uniref:Uncharacterized protein n=1 Tax=Kibdelosporangium aridum TaxID=2030 RepID=A0A428Z0F5_KIBAR|nr:hypothetical protein [Kibdelosporangium aridum]RSM77636.1 hypothetical protein DMH04_34540 [Kibdelosporangium aridum]
MDDTTSAQDFAALLPRIDKFARDLSDADRLLFDKMIAGAADTIMDSFQSYATEFGEAFRGGRTRLTVSYDNGAEGDLHVCGKYCSRYIKP